ncbi:uncharacterized protein LOC130774112 [Actinidia eriantha]|uniref:uncharacterized protein LOC130774112 n=1 Tax=Actinidia eriantha TaxID=165200 RepID=UPI0025854BF7|nr:uncharacterized protein LOC130774112 [Actinidia eriantha]
MESEAVEKNNSQDVMVKKGKGKGNETDQIQTEDGSDQNTTETRTEQHQQEDNSSSSSGENPSSFQQNGVTETPDFTQHQNESTENAVSKGDRIQNVLKEVTETTDTVSSSETLDSNSTPSSTTENSSESSYSDSTPSTTTQNSDQKKE